MISNYYSIYFPILSIQVSKYTIDEEGLKSKYKQIIGFHFVSSHTFEGIEELEKKIIETTLQEKYIGEKIPVSIST